MNECRHRKRARMRLIKYVTNSQFIAIVLSYVSNTVLRLQYYPIAAAVGTGACLLGLLQNFIGNASTLLFGIECSR